jgi:hypothetical protein
MNDNFVKIKDLITFDYLSTELISVKDDFDNKRGVFELKDASDMEKLDAKGLKVRIAATHSGIVTRNHMFYLPDKMKKAAPTFLEDFGKPFLKHHDEKQDAIGRAIDSSYVDTSGSIKDKLKDLHVSDSVTFNEKLLKDFCNGSMPFGLQVDVVRNFFNKPIKDKSTSIIEDIGYRGLGYVEVIFDVTDPDAIQKFLDGRFLTGSVGARTDRAVCSVCKQDWTSEGECEHTPGALYDERKCVLIAGNFFYDEYSVANNPADRQSRVLELYYNGKTKGIEIQNEYVGDAYEVKLGFPQYDSTKEEILMADKAKKIKDISEEDKELVALELEKVTNEKKVTDEAKAAEEAKKVEDEKKEKLSIEDKVTQLMDAEILDSDKLYDLMFEDEDLQDAKLSTEKRKSLRKSTFCGPDRSFPVPDCAHVTAARRLIGRYKGSGDKSKILACVTRKARAMGCDKKTKDAIDHARVLHMLTSTISEHLSSKRWRKEDGQEPVLSEDDIKSLTSVMKNLVVMVGKDSFVNALSGEELKDIVKHFQDIDLLDEIVSLEETLGDIRDELNETGLERDALKEEYELLQSDSEAIRDELIEEKKKVRDFQVDKLSILTSLKDGEIKEDKKEGFLELSDEVLESELTKLSDEVDIKEMAAKLNDGTSRKPEGRVKDPTLTFEDEISDEAKEELKMIDEAAPNFSNPNEYSEWRNARILSLINEGKLTK